MPYRTTNSDETSVSPKQSNNKNVTSDDPLNVFETEANCNLPIKDDMSSMEYPIYSLSKNRDIRIRVYSGAGWSVRIIPSVIGAATIFDKDIIIYCISQIVRKHNAGVEVSRRIAIKVRPFFSSTCRSPGGKTYERVIDMCRRLKGTTIETNIKTNEKEQTEGFGLIEDYRVTEWTKNGKGAVKLELTLSEWLYRSALDFDILTLHPDYFNLGQSLERRLYELARKHCGSKEQWRINLSLLKEKTGSLYSLSRFKMEVKEIVGRNALPDYHLALDETIKPNKLVVMTRDNNKHNKPMRNARKADKLTLTPHSLQKELF